MDPLILIVDPGSASKKYALYRGARALLSLHLEREGGGFVATIAGDGGAPRAALSSAQYDDGLGYALRMMRKRGVLGAPEEVAAAALRVVAPGEEFARHARLDAAYRARLDALLPVAPLHLAPLLEELAALERALPGAPRFAASDSAFHAAMPEVARLYGLPRALAARYGLYRYGYHGLSARAVVHALEAAGALPRRLVLCHLGGGASVMAIKDGASIDTSMGFSPLEGMVMATRSGSVAVDAALRLMEGEKMDARALEYFLNTECGLLGVSGSSDDVRELVESEKRGDASAALALDMFAYQARRHIGACAAALGGLDALVFTATIGERSAFMRARIAAGLEAFGVELDARANDAVAEGGGDIARASSRARVLVVPADEMGEMTRVALELLHEHAS